MMNLIINDKERYIFIDALKVVACFMVIILHTYSFMLNNDISMISNNFSNISIDSFLIILSIPAVNIFGIITGFLWYKKDLHICKIIIFWFIVFTYNLICNIFIENKITFFEFLKNFMPICTSRWWYINRYFCLLFFIPLISLFVEQTDNNKLTYYVMLLITVFLIFTLLNDSFVVNRGYSTIWLLVLAITGMYIKKIGVNQFFIKNAISFYALLFFLFLLGIYVLNNYLKFDSLKIYMFMTRYNFVIVFFMALSIFIIFYQMNNKIIEKLSIFSKFTLDVYLIHQPLLDVLEKFNILKMFLNDSSLVLTFNTIIIALALFIVSLIIAKFRIVIYDLLKINRKIISLSNFLERKLLSIG